MSSHRMSRYVAACAGNTRKAMTLYRLNLKLSQELFTIISCFEIALRNAIDRHYLDRLGSDWLRNAAVSAGVFDNSNCRLTAITIKGVVRELNHNYSHPKVVAELGFGFWRYLFSPHQYRAGGQTLLAIFPSRPASTPARQYTASYMFRALAQINNLRNRIAHHEAVCFQVGNSVKDITYARQHYLQILRFFQWMDIDEADLLYGLDHVDDVLAKIDAL